MTLSRIGHAFLEREKVRKQKERHCFIGSSLIKREIRDDKRKKNTNL